VVPRNLHTLISREILVEVNLTIDADGSIVRAEASPGEGPLNRSLARLAVATARLWKFKPAREGNRSVPGEIQIQFQFSPGP
jgi:TonB family protein